MMYWALRATSIILKIMAGFIFAGGILLSGGILFGADVSRLVPATALSLNCIAFVALGFSIVFAIFIYASGQFLDLMIDLASDVRSMSLRRDIEAAAPRPRRDLWRE